MKWILRRTLFLIFTFWAAVTINFFVVRLMPGSPMDVMINELLSMGYSYEEAVSRVALMMNFVPTAPIHEQYIDFVKGVMTGNLGYSIRLASPVTTVLGYGVPWTVFSVSISLVISFVLGILLGMYIAYHRGSIADKVLSLYSSVSRSIPQYIIGFFVVVVFAIQLGWFPAQGPYGRYVIPPKTISQISPEFVFSVLQHACLPVFCYVITTLGGWILGMKSSAISVLGEYYVTAAEARGLSDQRIMTTYVGRNALLPLFTQFAISLGAMFNGVVFIERVFLYPGIGSYFSNSIPARDYPLMSGCFLIIIAATLIANFLADVLHSRLDPRIKLE